MLLKKHCSSLGVQEVVTWDGLWEHWWKDVTLVVALVLKHCMSDT